jgi:hypothetical protein
VIDLACWHFVAPEYQNSYLFVKKRGVEMRGKEGKDNILEWILLG